MHADQNCNRAIKAYQEFRGSSDESEQNKPLNERIYLTNYLESVIEKFKHCHFSSCKKARAELAK